VKIAILGSGVIGTTAAYYLARDGHEVTVLERQRGPALETSFANAGEVSPGYASPWAGPGIPMKAIKWLLMQHSPLVIKPMLDPAMWRWGLATLANCTAARYRINKTRMVRLAEYSRDCLKELRAQTGIAYDERMLGTLQLFRTQKQLDGTAKDVEILEEFGVPYQLLDRDGYVRYEPALAEVRDKFVGGLRLAGRRDRRLLQVHAAARYARAGSGRAFPLRRRHRTDRVRCARGDRNRHRRRRGESRLLPGDARQLLDADARDDRHAPAGVSGEGLFDHRADHRRRVRARIDDHGRDVQGSGHAARRSDSRRRHGATSGFDLRLAEDRRRTLEFVVTDLFPRGGDVTRAEFWAGLRPMTPDGTPVVGPTPLANLWLATGHGTLGWTMAAGTGRLLADWMAGRKTEISTEGLALARYTAA
jgi:D-amino-acid dehydrogenase